MRTWNPLANPSLVFALAWMTLTACGGPTDQPTVRLSFSGWTVLDDVLVLDVAHDGQRLLEPLRFQKPQDEILLRLPSGTSRTVQIAAEVYSNDCLNGRGHVAVDVAGGAETAASLVLQRTDFDAFRCDILSHRWSREQIDYHLGDGLIRMWSAAERSIEDMPMMWSVGGNGSIYSYSDHGLWEATSANPLQSQPTNNPTLYSIAGSAQDNIWIGGDAGSLAQFDGSLWRRTTGLTTNTILGLFVAKNQDVWAVAASTKTDPMKPADPPQIFHYAQAERKWSVQADLSQSPTCNCVDLWGSSEKDIWAVGSAILHFDGTRWTSVVPEGSGILLWRVFGNSASDVFAVGYGGDIWHFDGTAWSRMSTAGLTSAILWDVWGSGPRNVYAATDSGSVLHYNGDGWALIPTGGPGMVTSVRGTGIFDLHILKRGKAYRLTL
jgi:hypothetical protein